MDLALSADIAYFCAAEQPSKSADIIWAQKKSH